MTKPQYRLGAEELIELGRPSKQKPEWAERRPFFGRARREGMGQGVRHSVGQEDAPADAARPFIERSLADAFPLLARLAGFSPALLVQDEDEVVQRLQDVLSDVPSLSALVAQVAVLARAAGASGAAQVLDRALDVLGADAKDRAITDARTKILSRAAWGQKDAVSAALSGPVPRLGNAAPQDAGSNSSGRAVAAGALLAGGALLFLAR